MEADTLNLIEKEFAHLKSVYFNSAYFGPSPLSSKKLIDFAVDKEMDPSFYAYNDWMSISERLRVKLADFLAFESLR